MTTVQTVLLEKGLAASAYALIVTALAFGQFAAGRL